MSSAHVFLFTDHVAPQREAGTRIEWGADTYMRYQRLGNRFGWIHAILLREVKRHLSSARQTQHGGQQVQKVFARGDERVYRRSVRLEVHRKRDAHPTPLLHCLDLVLALGEEGGPFDLLWLAAAKVLFFRAFGVTDDECTTAVLYGEGDDDGGYSPVVAQRAWLWGHATPACHDLESIPDRDEVVTDGEVWEERVADRVEDGVVRDLERGCEWEVGWVEERVAIWVYVDSCRLVWSTRGDQDVQRRRGVVIDIDGKVE